MTRPTRLTPSVLALLIAGVEIGLPYAVAAQRAGISESVLWEWIDRGRTARRRDEDATGELPPCPRCLAAGAEPCVSAAGNALRKVHAGRMTAPTCRDPELVALVVALELAEAEAHAHALEMIRSHGAEHWQAAAWFLERRYPELYARRTLGDLPAAPGSPPSTDPAIDRILESVAAYAARHALDTEAQP